jgi:Kdo2-lipid IVA lauroyltransferase/acyltransferase
VSRLVFGFMWLIHFLPLGAIAAVGNVAGALLYWLIPERRRVIRINLAKCFPDLPPDARERLARAHFRAFCRSFVERAILWWSSRDRIERMVRLEGEEHLAAVEGRPAILLVPHFVGLEAAVARVAMRYATGGMYSKQKDAVFERLLHRGRARFVREMHSRQDGIRRMLRSVASGVRYFYLPDMDFGPRGAVFVPFFGVPAATVTGLSFIARKTGAAVVPCVVRMLPGGAGYVARLYPAWEGFPSSDEVADARRMVEFIEQRVLEMPEQYFWLHKRFKTRPEGEPRFYP